MVLFSIRAVALISSIYFFTGAAGECFGANGTTADSNFPCGIGHTTFCCSSGYTCLSNEVCQWTDGTFWRGTCSSSNTLDASCPQFCPEMPGSPQMIHCSDTTWCCGGDQNCCNNPSSITTLPIASTIGSIGAGTIGFVVATSKGNLVANPTSTIQTTTSSRSSSSSSAVPTSTSSSSVLPATATSSTTSSLPSPTQTSKNSSNTGAIVGGTLGGAAIIAVVVAGGFYFLRRKQAQSAEGVAALPMVKHEGQYYQSAPVTSTYTYERQELSGTTPTNERQELSG